MNNKKICFIMCTNDEQYENEAFHFISKLNIPAGYSIDTISVKNATSLTSGYNEGMMASDAKYKVYLHQDVMIICPDFISNILHIFEDQSIGLIGMVGTPHLPENLIPWWSERLGSIYTSNIGATSTIKLDQSVPPTQLYAEVDAIDGLLMVTQYDIKWRDDLFDKWDFYDISQSFEFRKNGYKVVVPYMESPWCIHDDGFVNLKNYYGERRKAVREYSSKIS